MDRIYIILNSINKTVSSKKDLTKQKSYDTLTDPEILMDQDDLDDTSDKASRPGLWDNIRKKKEREGKKYRPAKPGDKDRPDPEQWKKLTKSEEKKKKKNVPIALPQKSAPPSHGPTTTTVVAPPAE
jgi:hypothetical protein